MGSRLFARANAWRQTGREQMTNKRAFLAVQGGLSFLLASGGAAAANRPVAPWPPPAGQLRLIVDSDTANEIDDQYALSLVLGSPDRFRLEGIIAAHFGDTGGASGIDKSYQEIQQVLEKAGMLGRFPVKRGSNPLAYRDQKIRAEGVDFIIEKAHSATPENPIWLVLIGPATDAAAALLKDPGIADRIVIFWHGRTAPFQTIRCSALCFANGRTPVMRPSRNPARH